MLMTNVAHATIRCWKFGAGSRQLPCESVAHQQKVFTKETQPYGEKTPSLAGTVVGSHVVKSKDCPAPALSLLLSKKGWG